MRDKFVSKIFTLFQVHLEGLRKNKLEFMVQGHQQTTTIDTWPYYEFEDYINLLNKRNEEERKAREDSEKKQYSSSDMKNISRMANSVNNFKQPNFNVPRF